MTPRSKKSSKVSKKASSKSRVAAKAKPAVAHKAKSPVSSSSSRATFPLTFQKPPLMVVAGVSFACGILFGVLLMVPIALTMGGVMVPADAQQSPKAATGKAASSAMPSPKDGPFIQSRLPVTSIAKAPNGGHTTARQLALRTEDEWNKLWADLPAVPRPARAIDFNRESVIAIFMGAQATAGYDIEVTHAVQADSETRVYVARSKPAPNCVNAQVQTAPYHVVSLPKIGGTVRFVFEDRVRSC